jgi:hypothetical protein
MDQIEKTCNRMKTEEKRFSSRNRKAMFAETGATTALRRRSRFCYPQAGDVRTVGHKRNDTESQWRKHGEVAQGIFG